MQTQVIRVAFLTTAMLCIHAVSGAQTVAQDRMVPTIRLQLPDDSPISTPAPTPVSRPVSAPVSPSLPAAVSVPAIRTEAPDADVHWTAAQVAELLRALDDAPADGLPSFAADSARLRGAISAGNDDAVDGAAQAAAVRLIRAHQSGTPGRARSGWLIEAGAGGGANADPAALIQSALPNNRLQETIDALRPTHVHYRALRAALASESNAARRATIIRNMDRWRWMPRDAGRRYILVNVPAYEAALWEDGHITARWRVVTGATRSPTPTFSTNVTGVIFNPWWELPTSIANEGVASMVRNNPSAAARRGYVYQAGRYRQRPGPGNALGRMQLVMPNNHTIYLHDPPSQGLFAQPVRAASHGCIRVSDAVGFAAQVLSTNNGFTRANADAIVASGRTQMVPLNAPIPVYIAYFTAEPDSAGAVRILPDIYRRD